MLDSHYMVSDMEFEGYLQEDRAAAPNRSTFFLHVSRLSTQTLQSLAQNNHKMEKEMSL